jgi:peptidoglycan/LPS O-acetylase OafA/YrhL
VSVDGARPGVAELYVPTFDGIRGLVSLSIALIHVQLALHFLPDHEGLRALRGSWYFSIEFLFLLGGFVAFLPLAYYGRFAGIRSYALRRAGRILPLYYVTLILAIVLGGWLRPVVGIDDALVPHDLEAFLIHLSFLQQELLTLPGFGVQVIVWTMSIVACFYVLFPLVARAYLRWPVLGLAAAVTISVAWRTFVAEESRAFLQFPLFLADFAIGMTAAYVYVQVRRRRGLGQHAALGLAGVGLIALLVLLYVAGLPIARHEGVGLYWHEGAALSLAVPTAFALVLVAAPFMPRWAQWPIANPVARWIGQVSYGLFLFHFLVIWSVLGVTEIPRDGSQSSVVELTLLVIPLTLLMGWLGTRFIEHPLRERAQRLAERSRRKRERPLEGAMPVPSPAK